MAVALQCYDGVTCSNFSYSGRAAVGCWLLTRFSVFGTTGEAEKCRHHPHNWNCGAGQRCSRRTDFYREHFGSLWNQMHSLMWLAVGRLIVYHRVFLQRYFPFLAPGTIEGTEIQRIRASWRCLKNRFRSFLPPSFGSYFSTETFADPLYCR